MADSHLITVYFAVLLMTPAFSGAQMGVTMPNITLVTGTSASIPCGYDGRGYFVSWLKSDQETLEADEYLVTLDKRPHPAKRTYDADRFNITDDNSLTIEDVHLEDEGRYFCAVFEYTSRNTFIGQTDVMVERWDILESVVTFHVGGDTTIQCLFNKTITTTNVRWMKDGLQLRDDNRYQASPEDFSLLVRHVNVMDEGTYVCEYFNSNEKTRYQHVAQVTVIGTPVSPFPVIDVCDTNMERTTQNCTYESSRPLIITCSVNNYFPNISLVFLHDQEIMKVLTSIESSNSNGTKNKEIFVRAAPSDEPYVCMALQIPGMDGERSAVITLTESKPPIHTIIIVLSVIVGLLVSVVIALLITLYMYWKYIYRREKGTDEQRDRELITTNTTGYTLDEERQALMLAIGAEAGCQTQPLPSTDAETGCQTQSLPSTDADTRCHTQPSQPAGADAGCQTQPVSSAGADAGCQTQPLPLGGADAGCQTQPVPSAGADAGCQTQPLPLAGADAGCQTQPVPSAGADAGCQTQPLPLAGADAGCQTQSVPSTGVDAGCQTQPLPLADQASDTNKELTKQRKSVKDQVTDTNKELTKRQSEKDQVSDTNKELTKQRQSEKDQVSDTNKELTKQRQSVKADQGSDTNEGLTRQQESVKGHRDKQRHLPSKPSTGHRDKQRHLPSKPSTADQAFDTNEELTRQRESVKAGQGQGDKPRRLLLNCLRDEKLLTLLLESIKGHREKLRHLRLKPLKARQGHRDKRGVLQ